MTDMTALVAYVTQPQVQGVLNARVRVGAHLDASAMCDSCRREATGESPGDFGGNVTSIFSACRKWDGCMVCAFCGTPRLEDFSELVVTGNGTPDCPKCGAVGVSGASRFAEAAEEERVNECRRAWIEWQRRIRCLELVGLAAGIAVFDARERGQHLAEEDVEQFFDAALALLRMSQTEETATRFFNRLQEAITLADEQGSRALPPVLTLAPLDASN